MAADEFAHATAMEEWTFEWWSVEVSGVAFYRLVDSWWAWYGWGLCRPGEPQLHVIEDRIRRRSDPMIAKAEAFWAQFTCEHSFEQWTIGSECHAVELDDPADALTGARGRLVPMASDLEWYATEPARMLLGGYEQRGVLLGDVETAHGVVAIPEVRSRRTHRWGDRLSPAFPPAGLAHLGPHVAFAVDGAVEFDLVLGPDGWSDRPSQAMSVPLGDGA